MSSPIPSLNLIPYSAAVGIVQSYQLRSAESLASEISKFGAYLEVYLGVADHRPDLLPRLNGVQLSAFQDYPWSVMEPFLETLGEVIHLHDFSESFEEGLEIDMFNFHMDWEDLDNFFESCGGRVDEEEDVDEENFSFPRNMAFYIMIQFYWHGFGASELKKFCQYYGLKIPYNRKLASSKYVDLDKAYSQFHRDGCPQIIPALQAVLRESENPYIDISMEEGYFNDPIACTRENIALLAQAKADLPLYDKAEAWVTEMMFSETGFAEYVLRVLAKYSRKVK